MAKFMQIIDVNSAGSEVVLHPESNADYIVNGLTNKVPQISEVADWNAKSKELVDARKGKSSLKAKIDELDTAVSPANLLASLKTVDGSGSGLDADTVDGRTVNDSNVSDNALWTSSKTMAELNKKVNSVDVSTTAMANKILKLDGNGDLPTNITKNSATTDRFKQNLTLQFSGDVAGIVQFNGSEGTKNVNMQIADNSHNHNELIGNGSTSINVTNSNDRIVDFKSNGQVVSSITNQGKFTGDAASVNGYSVSNVNPEALWTGTKIQNSINTTSETVARRTVESELMQYAQKTQDGIAIGPIVFKSGEVDISGQNAITIILGDKAGIQILNENYVIVSQDRALTYVKDPSSTNTNQRLIFNRTASPGSKILWYAVTTMN